MMFMLPLTRIAIVLAAIAFAPYAIGAQSDAYQDAVKLLKSGQPTQALERVDGFLKANPKDARARFLKGVILTEQNKAADAISIFSGLTEDFPELPEPYNNLAVLYAQQGQYDKARNALETAIRTHPNYAMAHENLGDIYARMASQAYDRALQLDKNNSAARTKLEIVKEIFSGARGLKPAASKAETVMTTASAAPASGAPVAAISASVETRSKLPVDATNEVIRTVNNWAKAWSDHDVNGYLGFYAPDFQPPTGEPRSDWEAARKLRIAKTRKVEVRAEAPKVKFAGNSRATVTFRQSYRSASLKAASTKTLVLIKSGDRWLIEQERIGS
ncbi:MAG TPA: tetratricopeptide repeat protein [Burkholderiales bacterium]|nr:tetratricopeptide repeat protein [Burkholderiales bacterium]